MPKLTNQQKQFCHEYVIDKNAMQAAIRAGYTEQTAKKASFAMLKKPEVKEYIDALLAEQKERAQLQADDVVGGLTEIAFADVRDYCSWNDQGLFLYDSDKLKNSRAIKSVKCSFGEDGVGRVEIVMHDKVKALENLAKKFGLLTEKTESKVDGRIELVISDYRTPDPDAN